MRKFLSSCWKIVAYLLSIFGIGSLVAGLIDFKNNKSSKHMSNGIYESYFKRVFDVFCSLLALAFLWPVLLIIAVLVKIKLGSPILFSQERPGLNEKIFKMYKFRSMTDERDEKGELLPDEVRLTKFGKFLRSTSMDELPELFSILKGDMSLIGPRPLLVKYLPYYTEKERVRHFVKPGLTGLAQVNGRNNLIWDRRLAMDVEYVNNITFIGDFKIFVKTIWNVLARKDIVEDTQVSEGSLSEIRNKTKK